MKPPHAKISNLTFSYKAPKTVSLEPPYSRDEERNDSEQMFPILLVASHVYLLPK